MNTIWLDFDGTVVDVLPRYYQVLLDYIFPERMNFENYCGLKRSGIKDHEIVYKLTGQDINVEDYMKYKKLHLEKEGYLSLDKMMGNPVRNYKLLKQTGYRIIILTQRREPKNFKLQLNQIQEKQGKICDNYVVVMPQNNQNSKLIYLEGCASCGDIVIGDSKMELECAQIGGIRVFLVNSGLGANEHISEFYSDGLVQYINNYDGAAKYLCEQEWFVN